MGYGFAGICMKFLVESSNMWWPTSLLDVTFYRALHEKDVRSKGKLTRLQFFFIVCVSSFAYYLVPTYLFPSIATLSFVCWIWKDSVTAQQIGSGRNGLGIGSFGLDWLTVTSFLGSPLALPTSSLFNSMAGFILLLYIIVPIAYWTNTYKSKLFPIISSNLYDMNGNVYNVSRVLEQKKFQFDQQGYDNYSQIYFSTTFAFSTALLFAGLSASFSHIALFHGRTFWRQFMEAKNEHTGDVHNRLMKKYERIPQYWFYTISILTIGLAIFSCEGFGRQLQLPLSGLLLAFSVGFILLLPLGGIYATTGLMPRTGLLSELITGYLFTGKPLANMTFITYAITPKINAIGFLSSFKVGHYMKIPPKSMFIVQIAGTLVSSSATFATGWWLLSNIENICHKDLLPKGSPWTCPGHNVFYNYSIVWGVIGPKRVFGPHSVYPQLYIFMVIGLVTTLMVWVLSCMFPDRKWIKLINMPNIFSGGTMIPPASALNYWSWLGVGLFFNFYVYNKFRDWWTRYSYLLSSGLDAGIAFMGLLVYLSLQKQDIYGANWWGLELGDHCPLATCPTAPGIVVDGCPVFS